MKKIVKITAFVLCFVMLFSVASVNCFAAEALDFDFNMPESKLFDYKKISNKMQEANKIKIPNDALSGDFTLEGNATYGYYAGAGITSLTIGSNCDYIDEFAFAFCQNLKTVIINSWDCEIDPSAFVGCINLEKFVINTDNEYYSVDSKGVLFNKDKTYLYYAPAKAVGSSYTMPSTVEAMYAPAFVDCKDFSLTISKKFEYEDGAFFGVSVNEFKVSAGNSDYKAVDGVLYTKDGTELVKYPVDSDRLFYSIPDSVEYIPDDAFVIEDVLASMMIMYFEFDDGSFNNDYVYWKKAPVYLTVHISEQVLENSSGAVLGVDRYCVEGIEKSLADEVNHEFESYKDYIKEMWEEEIEAEIEIGTPMYYFAKAYILKEADIIPTVGVCDEVHNEVIGYEVVSYPDKYDYAYKTDALDLTGLELEVVYLDGRTEKFSIEDADEVIVNGFNNAQRGVQTVTLEIDGVEVSFEVEVDYLWWQWLIVIFLFGWIWY